FRRQFIIKKGLGPKTWNKEIISENLYLYCHPDLGFYKSFYKDRSLILLGFVIDPYKIEDSNQEITDRLVKSSNDFKSLLENSKPLSGRWLIIYKDKEGIKLFNDPSGLRQVHYNKDFTMIGSNPS